METTVLEQQVLYIYMFDFILWFYMYTYITISYIYYIIHTWYINIYVGVRDILYTANMFYTHTHTYTHTHNQSMSQILRGTYLY